MTDSHIIFKIDSDLKTEFKIKVLQEKKTITNVLTEYVKEYVK